MASIWNRLIGWLGSYGPRDVTGTQVPIPQDAVADLASPVTFDTAMQLSAFWACARLISETVGGLPIAWRDKRDGAVIPAADVSVGRLFADKVNRYQTGQEFLETEVLNLCTHGNCYALKQLGASGQLVGLLPLMAPQMEARTLPDGSLVYIYYTAEKTTVYAEKSIWHVRLFGNGKVGLSPLGFARNALGIGLATEKRVAQVFNNGAKPTGILMYDKVLTKEQRAQIRTSFSDLAEGNNDSLIVLEAGMKYEQVSMSPQDVQLLESRRFQIEDICRFMGVPSVLVNDTSASTTWGSGVEQLIGGWYKLGLRPYLVRLETSIAANLLTPLERQRVAPSFEFDALLRADRGARFDAHQKGINAGMMTPNEARKAEGLPPVDGGDRLLVNGNMVPVESVTGRPATTTLPAGRV